MLADFIARNLAEMTHQLDLLAAEPVAFLGHRLAAQLLEEKGNRPVEKARGLEQAAGTQPVLAMLVFLHGLERNADSGAELFLTHSREKARLTQATSHMNIDGIG